MQHSYESKVSALIYSCRTVATELRFECVLSTRTQTAGWKSEGASDRTTHFLCILKFDDSPSYSEVTPELAARDLSPNVTPFRNVRKQMIARHALYGDSSSELTVQ